jgi:hypothetical protein
MNSEEAIHLQQLLTEHKRRVYELELQAAKFGANCPPHVKTEIEDIYAKIKDIDNRIDTNTIRSFYEGRQYIQGIVYDLESINHKLQKVEVKKTHTVRLFGIPILSITSIISRTSTILFFILGAAVFMALGSVAGLTANYPRSEAEKRTAETERNLAVAERATAEAARAAAQTAQAVELERQATQEAVLSTATAVAVESTQTAVAQATLQSQAAATAQIPTRCQIISSVSIHRAPSNKEPVIWAFDTGTIVMPLARDDSGFWVQLQDATAGRQGWVIRNFVSCNFDLASLPINNNTIISTSTPTPVTPTATVPIRLPSTVGGG